MGPIRYVEPVLFLAAAFSRYPAALDWARQKRRPPGGRWPWRARASRSTPPTITSRRWGRGSKMFLGLRAAGRSGAAGRTQAPGQRLGNRVCRRQAGHRRAAAFEHRPGLSDPGQAGAGIDQGSRPSDLSRPRHLCRSDAVLSEIAIGNTAIGRFPIIAAPTTRPSSTAVGDIYRERPEA